MKNKKNLIIGIQFAAISLLGFLFYRTQKRLDKFVDRIESASKINSQKFDLEWNVKYLELCRSDTVNTEAKSMYYHFVKDSGSNSIAGLQLFNFVCYLRENKNNAEKLLALETQYENHHSKIRYFFLMKPNYNDLKSGDIDTLVHYHKNLGSIADQVRNFEIEPN